MIWMAIAALIPAATSAIAAAASSGDRSKAEDLRQKAMKEYDIDLPPLETLEAEMQTDSELQKIVADPKYTQAQDSALGMQMDMAKGSGLMPEDVATLERAKREAAGVERGILGRNQQSMMARGISGSGLDLSNQMQAGQSAIDRAYQSATQAAGDASARRQNALFNVGNFAARLRESDLGQKNRAASAQDEINRFNTADKRDMRDYNERAKWSRYDRDLALRDRRYNAVRGRANDADEHADRTQEVITGTGAGISQAVGAGFEYDQANKKKK